MSLAVGGPQQDVPACALKNDCCLRFFEALFRKTKVSNESWNVLVTEKILSCFVLADSRGWGGVILPSVAQNSSRRIITTIDLKNDRAIRVGADVVSRKVLDCKSKESSRQKGIRFLHSQHVLHPTESESLKMRWMRPQGIGYKNMWAKVGDFLFRQSAKKKKSCLHRSWWWACPSSRDAQADR
jgi:hypothetical protein